jgi:hypothetical protein
LLTITGCSCKPSIVLSAISAIAPPPSVARALRSSAVH